MIRDVSIVLLRILVLKYSIPHHLQVANKEFYQQRTRLIYGHHRYCCLDYETLKTEDRGVETNIQTDKQR